MSRARSSSAAVSVRFTVAEKQWLMRRTNDTSQLLADYIRERVLAEGSCEEETLGYLVEELTRVAEDNRQAIHDWKSKMEEKSSVDPRAERDRIAKEVCESLTQQKIVTLAAFFRAAFDAGLWPGLRGKS